MPLDIRLDPAACGLVVIDLQNGFCHPEGTRGRAFGPDAVTQPASIVPAVIDLVHLARRLDVPVWFTRQVHFAEADQTRSRRLLPGHLARRGAMSGLCQEGTWDADLLDEVAAEVRAPEEVVIKHRASAFFETRFPGELRMRGVQALVVTGTTTSFCVDSTIRDAYARDFDVIVPAECVADSDEAAHQAVLATTDRFHGVVTDRAELAAAWGATEVWEEIAAASVRS